MVAVVRSDRAADWLGRTIERIGVVGALARLGRAGASRRRRASIHRFRDQLGEVVRRRGLAALVVTIVAQIPWWIAFVVALRLTGVPADVLTPVDVLAVFALVERHHDHPDRARRRRRSGAAVHRRPDVDRRPGLRGRDHGRRLPVPAVRLVPADPDRLDPAQARAPRPADAADDAVELRSYAAAEPG